MFERIAHISTAIASVVAIFMLVISVNQNNRLNEQQFDLDKSRILEEWKRSVLFEAIMINRIFNYQEIENHYVKRASQSVTVEVPNSERTKESIVLSLAQMVEQGTVVVDDDGLYIPKSLQNDKLMFEYIGNVTNSLKGPMDMAYSIVDVLLEKGGEADVKELADLMSAKHPDQTIIDLRAGFLAAQQNRLIKLEGEFGPPVPGEFGPNFKPNGIVTLDSTHGLSLFK